MAKRVYTIRAELSDGDRMAYASRRAPRDNLIPIARIPDIAAAYNLNRRADRNHEPENVYVGPCRNPFMKFSAISC